MKLAERGLRIVQRPAQNFLPAPDGSYLLTGEGRYAGIGGKTAAGTMPAPSRLSRAELEAIADVLRQFVLRRRRTSSRVSDRRDPRSLQRPLGTAGILRKLSLEQQRNLLDLFTRSAGEMLDERFENDLVKALFGFDAIVGNYASPTPRARPM